jgi:general secretion pathway protein E
VQRIRDNRVREGDIASPDSQVHFDRNGMTPPSTLHKANQPRQQTDKRLTLEQLLAELVADKLVARDTADKLLALRRNFRGDIHPLVIFADQKWKDPRNPKKLLNLETLTEWLAGKAGLPYLHIDPFKIDFAAVTKVMSNAYAARFRILPVGVTSTERLPPASLIC